MNKNVRIKVKTPVGITETEDTGPVASQGSVDAAVISSVSLGNGVSKAFEDSTYEIAYGNIEMSAQIFVDDVFRMGENVESAQYANNVMEELVGKKSLKLNFDKSSYVIMGNKKCKRIMSSQLKKTPLMLNNKEMQEEKMIKYLGDFLASNLEKSVHNTVVKRASIARHSIYEIRSVVEDTRADRAGALNIAFDLWEQGLLGMILYNSETWVSMKKKTLKVLDDLFHLFCRVVLRTTVSCPKVSFYWESASLTFSNHILLRKLNFSHHLSRLPEGSLAREIWEEQINNKEYPGLCREVEEHISAMGFEISELQTLSKWQFKKSSKEYIQRRNKDQLLEDIKNSKKLNYEKLSEEKFERKEYFFKQNLENSRMLFHISSRLVPCVKANYPSKYRRQGKPLSCSSCPLCHCPA